MERIPSWATPPKVNKKTYPKVYPTKNGWVGERPDGSTKLLVSTGNLNLLEALKLIDNEIPISEIGRLSKILSTQGKEAKRDLEILNVIVKALDELDVK
ncbi:MAG: hypothetical protein KAS32_23815 [Candidatus Peribacteraceae bacterium]|nr:hypothetical protein [Candidatus Peribacteraceae bacterium]